MRDRQSTGIPQLDDALGGGFLPGTMVMVIGATGVGKTQLATHFAHADVGSDKSTPAVAVIDLSSRGDSQNHTDYAQRMYGTQLRTAARDELLTRDPFDRSRPPEIFPFLGYGGRRVLRSQMDADQWHAWQSELNRRTPELFRYVYSQLVSGTRRFVVDGIEPIGGTDDSLQFDLLELIYHRMLRHEHDWLAREVLRQDFRANAGRVEQQAYRNDESTLLVLVTTKQNMLEQLIVEPLADGDLAAGANTVLLMGRQLEDGQLKRALYVAKHRGSFADQSILPFEINDQGLQFS